MDTQWSHADTHTQTHTESTQHAGSKQDQKTTTIFGTQVRCFFDARKCHLQKSLFSKSSLVDPRGRARLVLHGRTMCLENVLGASDGVIHSRNLSRELFHLVSGRILYTFFSIS